MQQLYYTACPTGHGLGKAHGEQVKRRDRDYPVPADARHFLLRPFLPGTSTLVPSALRYRRDGDAAEIIALSPREFEFETERGFWGKPGGCFAHAIRVDAADLAAIAHWPAGLHDGLIWTRSDPEPTHNRPPEPTAMGLDRAAMNRAPTFGAVRSLADDLDADGLARLLTALAGVARNGRTLVLIDDVERLADRVALLTFALPGPIRETLTFSTYHDRPEDLPGYRIQGAPPEARSRAGDLAALGACADLTTMTFTPPVEPAPWAVTLASYFKAHGNEGQDSWEALERLSAQAPMPGLAREAWAEHRLDGLIRARPSGASGSSASSPVSPAAPIGPETPKVAAVGIDLGTTFSVVAHLDALGRPVTLQNSSGDILTPSVLFLEDDGVVVGKEAVAAATLDPDRLADCIKRDMGQKSFHKELLGKTWPPEVLSSLILKKLKEDAEAKIGPFSRAVVTVPAYFDEPRRRATIDAARLAGLDVPEVINEPTAAALAFAHQEGLLDASGNTKGGKPIRALVYDLGGGTFDVTVVHLQAGDFRAIATDGDVYLGGRDWDQELADLAAEKFLEAHGVDPRDDTVTRLELLQAAEGAKRALTERPRASMIVNHRGNRLKVDIARGDFEERTAMFLERTRTTTDLVALQAGLTWSEIDRVLLVGGSTRMPMVRKMLKELTGKEPDATLPADEAVALGAAIYSGLLLRRSGAATTTTADFNVTNVNAHSLGLIAVDTETKRKVNKILIPKNTPLPHRVKQKFKTYRDDQKSVKLSILEGESEMPDACTVVGEAVIRGLPRPLAAGAPIEVRYHYEADGTLKLYAGLIGHTASIRTEFQRVNELSDEDFAFWVEHLGERQRQIKF